MKDSIIVNKHTWEQQERGWWTSSCGTTNYGTCHENDGWYLYGPGTANPRGPYRVMKQAMEQMPPTSEKRK